MVTKKGLDFSCLTLPTPTAPPPPCHVLRVCFLNNDLSSYCILLFETVSPLMAETLPNFGLPVSRIEDVMFSRLPLEGRVLTHTVTRLTMIYPLNFSFHRSISWKLRDSSGSDLVQGSGKRGLRKLAWRISLFLNSVYPDFRQNTNRR
jgi:hypothetical protein